MSCFCWRLSVQTCVFPQMLPFLFATYPNLMLILDLLPLDLSAGSASGMCYGLVAGLLMDLFLRRPHGILYAVLYLDGIFKRHMPPDIITRIISRCLWPSAWSTSLAYNLYLYVFRLPVPGDAWPSGYLPYKDIILPETVFTTVVTTLCRVPPVPAYQQDRLAFGDGKKERHDHCLTTCTGSAEESR